MLHIGEYCIKTRNEFLGSRWKGNSKPVLFIQSTKILDTIILSFGFQILLLKVVYIF